MKVTIVDARPSFMKTTISGMALGHFFCRLNESKPFIRLHKAGVIDEVGGRSYWCLNVKAECIVSLPGDEEVYLLELREPISLAKVPC